MPIRILDGDDQTDSQSYSYVGTGYLSGSYNGTASSATSSVVLQNGARGWDIPNYHRRKNKGELLPYTSWKQWSVEGRMNDEAFNATFRHHNSSSYDWTISGSGVLYANPISLSFLEELAEKYSTDLYVQEAASRIYSRNFDAATFAAELGLTVRMFKGFLKRLASNLKSGRLEDVWLEGRYGWRILYYDALEIQQLIENFHKKARQRYIERVGSDTTERTTSVVYPACPIVTGHWHDSSQVNISDEIVVGLRGSVAADINIRSARVNLATTAWEVTTLSFVIDWIISVGSWLESMSLLVASSQVVAAGGKLIEVTRNIDGEFIPDTENLKTGSRGTQVRTGSAPVSGQYRGYICLRSPTSLPYSPQLNLRLNELKVLDLAALTAQRLRRRK